MVLAGTHKKINFSTVGDVLYLSAVALYVLEAFFSTTLFCLVWPTNYTVIVRMLLCTSLFLKACITQRYSWSTTRKAWLLCILTILLFKLSWISTGYVFLLDTALLMVGASGIPYRKILKVGFWTGLYVLLIAMLGSFTGCINDLVYPGTYPRHSFGIVYPTDYAAHIAFLALAGWVIYGGSSILFPIASVLGLAGFVFFYSRSKCSTGILLLLAVTIFYCSFTEHLNQKHKAIYVVAKWIDRILPYIMPFCALAIIGITFFYKPDNELMKTFNYLLSYRLSLGKAAMDKYGITLLGTAFEQIGFGGGTAWTWTYTYNFVDSSYVLILVRYGLVVLLAVCILHMVLVKNALKYGHRQLALAAALMAVHSIIEHHLLEVAYNLFLLIPFADLCSQEWKAKDDASIINISKHLRQHRSNRRQVLLCAAILVGCTATILLFPGIIRYFRTIVNILQWDTEENNIYFIGTATVILTATILFFFSMLKTIVAWSRKNPLPKSCFIGLALFSLTLLYALLAGEQVISQNQKEFQPLIEEDRPIIEALLEAEGIGRLYVDHVPELYQREFQGLSNMVLAAEGLTYKQNATLITEDLAELENLIEAGYEFGVISPSHAVYTNSAAAKKVMEKLGITFTDYYSRQRIVDLEAMAVCNGLALTNEHTLILNESWQSVSRGLGVTIYKGILQVEYQLQLTGCIFTEGTVAITMVTSDWGQRTWNKKEISLSDFDENGHCTYVFETNLPFSCPNMEFLLYVSDGVTLEIQEIKYGKVG